MTPERPSTGRFEAWMYGLVGGAVGGWLARKLGRQRPEPIGT